MINVNIKSNVVLHHETFRRPEMFTLVIVARMTCPAEYTPTITSGAEGRHSANPWSKHYTGWALDFRIRDLTEKEVNRWVFMLTEKLGIKYLVLLEPTHIHVHYKGNDA